MSTQKARESVTRLQALSASPVEQLALAKQLLARERNTDIVLAALRVLEDAADSQSRPLLHDKYDTLDQNGTRRDPAGTLRIAVLRALQPIALPDDAPLFERATQTYEFLYGESTGDLRAAGLTGLLHVDSVLAGYHAVRLLTDNYTSEMSGEPAATAARVLASQGHDLPLYGYLFRDGPEIADVVAECLRNLTTLPATLLAPLVERYIATDNEIVLLGLFDLLLEHAAFADYTDMLLEFLRTTDLLNIHRYLVSALVARRDAPLIDAVERMGEDEKDDAKASHIRDALALR